MSLYVVSMARMEQIEEAGLDLCMKLPGIALYGIYKILFYLILPYGIMATLPVQRMIGEWNRCGRAVHSIYLYHLEKRPETL